MNSTDLAELRAWQRELEQLQFERTGNTSAAHRTNAALTADRQARLLQRVLAELERSPAERFRAAQDELLVLRGSTFAPGTAVAVKCAQYTGNGVVVQSNSAPLHCLAVRLAHGNVSAIPMDACHPIKPA